MKKQRPRPTASKLALLIYVLTQAGLVATAQSTPDLSGQWNSNIGAVYEIQQSGGQFTWSAPSFNQSGTGTVSGNDITMSGPGWTVKGTITEKDASGKPTKIVGENGVILFRTTGSPAVSVKLPAQKPVTSAPKPPAGGAIDISGQWNSNIGAIYEIQQNGDQFTWSAPSLSQSGGGTLSGMSLTLNGPGWTVKGSVTESNASGKPTKIVGENGVVLFRELDGQAGQVPPQGQAGIRATGDWSKFENLPPPSPQILTKVSAPMTRKAMIDTLSGSPITQSTLEKVATSAGTTVGKLKVQTLSGQQALDMPISPDSPSAQAFLDLWKSPVHFSPTMPGPSYLDGGLTRVVGVTKAHGVYVHPGNSLQMMAQKDYFLILTEGLILIHLDLPPGGGQYMVAVHAVDIDGTAANTQSGLPIADAYLETSGGIVDKIPLVKNTTNTALVGLFSESPGNAGWSYGPIDSMPHVSVNLRIFVTAWGWAYYTGITVTRL